jgi:predicted RNA-binding protein with PUA-like domain
MQIAVGTKGTHWSGVRNHLAKKNLMAMRKGDRGFFYHSNEGKDIVGTVEVIREHYPDPTAESGEPWVVVDLKAVSPLPKPVTLADIRAEAKLSKMSLVTSARLSVQPVTEPEWKLICKMGGLK